MFRSPVLSLAVLALVAGPATASVRPDGRWLRDEQGRALVIHGLQVAHKKPPYHPPPQSFDEEDARSITEWGFNAVRLAWFWAGLEPERGRIDSAYLDEIVREGRVLGDQGIYTLLEAHQDAYSERVNGAGFPDWATITDGVPVLPPGPLEPQMPAVNRAFDNLYANTDGIADAFARAWSVMAGAFRDHPRMLGYDLFNEPYPGSHFPTCANPAGCPAFDTGVLQPTLNRLAAGVRTQDPATPVFYEPNIYFDFGAASWLGPPPAASDPAAFAFHVYCLGPKFVGEPDKESESPAYATCDPEEEQTFQNATATAAAMGVPPLLDEFGDTQDLAYLQRVVDFADRHLMGWMYWSYKDWIDAPGGAGSGALFDDSNDNATLRQAKLRVLSRPYPQATAGTPLEYRFERDSGRFAYTYEPDPSIEAPTVVFVPPLHYPDGYRVEVTGAQVVSSPDAAQLELVNESDARRVRLTVTPAPAARPAPRAEPPPAARRPASRTRPWPSRPPRA